ncbi:MAG: NAD(P)H-dependent oxidoreductase [Pseudomonadota bacterium]
MDIMVFLGSRRASAPPRPARLGERVARAFVGQIEGGGHQVTLIDPLDFPALDEFKPHFSYRKGAAPEPLDVLAGQIGKADAYVMVSPEYNHSMSPALADLLNHFGASLFAYKPSLIATYSAGQWGGARAAMNMRAYLGELGCLPVSAMVHVPKAHEVFDADGGYLDTVDADRWDTYLGRGLGQLAWWGAAARSQRAISDGPGPFQRDPSQRNAPS